MARKPERGDIRCPLCACVFCVRCAHVPAHASHAPESHLRRHCRRLQQGTLAHRACKKRMAIARSSLLSLRARHAASRQRPKSFLAECEWPATLSFCLPGCRAAFKGFVGRPSVTMCTKQPPVATLPVLNILYTSSAGQHIQTRWFIFRETCSLYRGRGNEHKTEMFIMWLWKIVAQWLTAEETCSVLCRPLLLFFMPAAVV